VLYKIFRNKEKQTDLFQIHLDRRKTHFFDSDLENKNSGKSEGLSFFGTKAKSKRFDPEKSEVLTLLQSTSRFDYIDKTEMLFRR